METRGIVVSAFVLIAICSLNLGCGGGPAADQPDLGLVQGTVTMDSQPLSGATVIFLPEQGRPSAGTTDGAGKYELTYLRETKGAKVGTHSVRIQSVEEGAVTDTEETIPAKYNVETTLTAQVKPGKNTFDFALESK